MTSEPTNQNHIQQTLWSEDFLAKICPVVANALVSQKKRGLASFTNSCESYAWFDPNTSSWKTWPRSLITDWELFSESFPRQGLMQNGELFEQAIMSEPPTTEIDGFALQLTETLPTPTAMDIREDGLKHATKMLQGKTHRSSGQPIQVTLSDKVMMNQIKDNPELMKIYQDHQIQERPYLPSQEEFVSYLRKQATIKELATKTNIRKTKIEHWFRKDKAGFSYPSIEDWEVIKPHLIEIQFDKEMTTVKTKEWTSKSPILPTPTASDIEGGTAKDVQFKNGSFVFTGRTRKGKGGE